MHVCELCFISLKLLMTSANIIPGQSSVSGKSFMYNTKSSDPRTLPYETPLSTVSFLEAMSFTIVCPFRKAVIQFRMTPLMIGPRPLAFYVERYQWFTMSEIFPRDIASTRLSKNVSSYRTVDRPPRKLNCLADNRLCLFKYVRIVSLTAASIFWQVIKVRETGR